MPTRSGKTKGIKPAPGAATARVHASFQRALAFHKNGQLQQAQGIYEEIIKAQPRHCDALHLLGVIACQRKDYRRAVTLIDKAIEIQPNVAMFFSNRGIALQELLQLHEAVASFDKAIELRPDYAEAYSDRGSALLALNQPRAALASYDKAIGINPSYFEAYSNRGNALLALDQSYAALASYDKSVGINPQHVEAHFNRGNALLALNQAEAALASYGRAIALRPDYAEAYSSRGAALLELRQPGAALACHETALNINPALVEAHFNRGNALLELGQHAAAAACFDKAVGIRPDYAEAYHSLGNTLLKLKRHQAAIESYDKAIALKSDCAYLPGDLLYAKMQICDWEGLEKLCSELEKSIRAGRKSAVPFVALSCTSDPGLQRNAAAFYANDKYPAKQLLPPMKRQAAGDKIRIGYFSADYHDHATTYLMAELFERHDRTRFELVAFSFGPDAADAMRKRVAAAFDRFIDVRAKSDTQVTMLSRDLGIDIAVDLKGYTQDCRPGIFASRAAPLQVSYLGYPGTMGASYIDYLIADRTLIPEESQSHYSEKIIYLPNSYQVNDAHRQISTRKISRKDCGLPDHGMVFCCFNSSYKITPSIFSGWMRILNQVEDSVLWLLEGNPVAADNLRKAAISRGIDAARLVFAASLPLAEHLARHQLADLFLDTFPVNAHTTASDALWAGLPVLTRSGETFASRVAASLLNAIRLPELIADSQEEYEALAIGLATDPVRLGRIKEKLTSHRSSTPLFDTALFTQHIEAAYLSIYKRYQAGQPADHLSVAT